MGPTTAPAIQALLDDFRGLGVDVEVPVWKGTVGVAELEEGVIEDCAVEDQY